MYALQAEHILALGPRDLTHICKPPLVLPGQSLPSGIAEDKMAPTLAGIDAVTLALNYVESPRHASASPSPFDLLAPSVHNLVEIQFAIQEDFLPCWSSR